MEPATAPTKPSSPQLTELVTAILAVITVKPALTKPLAPLVFLPTPGQLITNVSAVQGASLMPAKTASHALLAARAAPQQLFATAASAPWSSKAQLAKLAATMASPSLAQLVLDALLVASNAPKTFNATTVLTTSTYTMEDATLSALPALSVTKPEETGTVFLATHPARPASTTLHIVPVA
jgi:hypothetical protein